MIALVLSNPRHHAEMMLPVARALAADGTPGVIVSLAELRGLVTPSWLLPPGWRIIRAVPAQVRRSPSAGAGVGLDAEGRATGVRRALRAATWAALGLRLRVLLRDADAVLIPNDAAFPYDALAAQLGATRTPFVLLQEGIRFPLPNESATSAYGRGGADRVCAWGDGSAEHFARVGVPSTAIRVTGNPRFDDLARDRFVPDGAALQTAHGATAAPLVLMSNPVDDQGFCSADAKAALLRATLVAAAPVLAARGVPLWLKLHPREDRAAMQALCADAGVPAVVLPAEAGIFPTLAAARAVIVLASTVGLEAMAFEVPVAVLPLPGHGHVFEYVSRGAAYGLDAADLGGGIATLLDHGAALAPAAAALVVRHLGPRGTAAAAVAAAVHEVARA